MIQIVTDQLTWDYWNETGEWALFREGGYSHDLRTRTRQMMQRNGIPQGTTGNEHPVIDAPMHPPVEFVEWAKPCETCGGKGYRRLSRPDPTDSYDSVLRKVSCPDCIDGKRRVAVVVPCYYRDEHHLMSDCVQCSSTGLVTVGHVVVEWGPLVVVDGFRNIIVPDCLVVTAQGEVWRVAGSNAWERGAARVVASPDTDPATLDGKYAIGGKVVVTP